jgi:hypothetical protein
MAKDEKAHCCSDCDCSETCTKTGCVGMATERERCEAVAGAGLCAIDFDEMVGAELWRPAVLTIADLIARERAAARAEALEEAANVALRHGRLAAMCLDRRGGALEAAALIRALKEPKDCGKVAP